MWDVGGITGNQITLRKPWSGPALSSGTAIRNAVTGEALIAAALNQQPLQDHVSVNLAAKKKRTGYVIDRLIPLVLPVPSLTRVSRTLRLETLRFATDGWVGKIA